MSGQSVGCIKSRTGSTGRTINGLVGWLEKKRYPVYWGENAEDLAIISSSNREDLLEEFHGAGWGWGELIIAAGIVSSFLKIASISLCVSLRLIPFHPIYKRPPLFLHVTCPYS
jgi:hypothetical protein